MNLCLFMQASHKFLNEGNQFFLMYNKKIQVFYLRLDTPFCALFTSPPLSFPIRFTRINKSHSLSNLCFFCTLQSDVYIICCTMQKNRDNKLKKNYTRILQKLPLIEFVGEARKVACLCGDNFVIGT